MPYELNRNIDNLVNKLHEQYEMDSRSLLKSIQQLYGPTVYLLAICFKNYDCDFDKYQKLQPKFKADSFDNWDEMYDALYSEELNPKINACLTALAEHKRLRDEYFPPIVRR